MKNNNKKKKYSGGLVLSLIILWYCIASKQNSRMIIAALAVSLLFILLFLNTTDIKRQIKRIKLMIKKKHIVATQTFSTTSKKHDVVIQISDVNIKSLSLISKKALSKMLSENDNIYSTPSLKNNKSEIRSALYQMLNDTKQFKTIFDFENLYTKGYFVNIIEKYFFEIILNVEKNNEYDIEVDDLYFGCENIYKWSLNKINYCFFDDLPKSLYIIGRTCGIKEINTIINLLTIYSAITIIVFLESKINNLSLNDELYKIISKMITEIGDMEIIYKKLLPIYHEFYREKLGFVNDNMFKIAIIIIKDTTDNSNEIDNSILTYGESNYENIDNISSLDNVIKFWLESLAKGDVKINNSIICIVAKIDKSIVDDNDLLLDSFHQTYKWNNYYKDKITLEKKQRNKRRYLNGDFTLEKEEKSLKYNMMNLHSGNDFELYLVNLFRELNYKVKHCGKTGDQGGDLIVSKNDITYVVQAKYYSNKLDNTSIQEVVGAIRFYNTDKGIVITNSTFTSKAKELAEANKIILIDGEGLKKLVEYIYEENKDTDYIKNFMR